MSYDCFTKYDLGSSIKLAAVFKLQEDNSLVDPDTVSLSTKKPDGTITTIVYGTDDELVRDDVGSYHANISADTAGVWYYRWFSTGSGQAAAEQMFEVEPANALNS